MIHPISPDMLGEKQLRDEFYPDLTRTLFWSTEWDPDFYVALAKAGFISISMRNPEYGVVLVPELQKAYAVLDWPNLHVSRSVQRLRRSEQLSREDIELRVVGGGALVLDHLLAYHKTGTWLAEPYCDLLKTLPFENGSGFALRGIELWSRKQEKLVAGELGYTIGRTYTSLSGFCTRPAREWRHFGTLQMIMLAERLRDFGYAFWNMGHPVQKYKRALGARIIAREEFLPRWLAATCEEPVEVLDGALPNASTRKGQLTSPGA